MGWGTALLLASVIAFPLFALKHMDNVKKAFRLWTIGILLLTLPFLRGPDVSYHFLENFKFYTGIPVI